MPTQPSVFDATSLYGKPGATGLRDFWSGSLSGCAKLLWVKAGQKLSDVANVKAADVMLHVEPGTDAPLDPAIHPKTFTVGMEAVSKLARAVRAARPTASVWHWCPPTRIWQWVGGGTGHPTAAKDLRAWRKGLRTLKANGYGKGLTGIIANCYEFADYEREYEFIADQVLSAYEDIFNLPVLPLMMPRFDWSGGAAQGGELFGDKKLRERMGFLHERCGRVGVWDALPDGYERYEAWGPRAVVESFAKEVRR